MSQYAMTCLTCGGPLDDRGRCPHCQPTEVAPQPWQKEDSRGHAVLGDIAGAPTGTVDSTGTYQRDGQSTSWTPRVFAYAGAGVTAIVTAVLVLVCLALVVVSAVGIGYGLTHHRLSFVLLGVVGLVLGVLLGLYQIVGISTFIKHRRGEVVRDQLGRRP